MQIIKNSIKESDLYLPLKIYLEAQGYKVNSEVIYCDITAVKNDEFIIIELKTSFSISLLIQAVRRKEITDSVYVAVPVVYPKRELNNFNGIKRLVRYLEIGLILVRFQKTKTRIEIVSHPYPYNKRKSHKRKNHILKEIDGRYVELNKAGRSRMDEHVSSRKQAAIKIAFLLDKINNASPSELVKMGTGSMTQSILSANYYGWFEKIERGVYGLNSAGRIAYKKYEKLVEIFNNETGN